MDDFEQRILAHEMALVEVAGWISEAHLEDAMKAIGDGLVEGITDDERSVRLQAIQLLDDALHRYRDPAEGIFFNR